MPERTNQETPTAEEPISEQGARVAADIVESAPLGRMGELERQERAGEGRASVLRAIAKRREAAQSGGGEPTHTVDEFAAAAGRWRTLPAIVMAAFAEAGITDATPEEADALITEFRDRPAPHPNDKEA